MQVMLPMLGSIYDGYDMPLATFAARAKISGNMLLVLTMTNTACSSLFVAVVVLKHCSSITGIWCHVLLSVIL